MNICASTGLIQLERRVLDQPEHPRDSQLLNDMIFQLFLELSQWSSIRGAATILSSTKCGVSDVSCRLDPDSRKIVCYELDRPRTSYTSHSHQLE